MGIQNQVAMITGSGVRLGRSIALALADAGMDVCVHYRNSQTEAEDLARQIQGFGRRAIAIQADLSDSANASRDLMKQALEYFGKVNALINNASLFREDQFGEISEEDWEDHFSVNLKTPFFLSQELVHQQNLKNGHIINITDWRATRPGNDHLVYTMTKAALVTMTKSLALELSPNICVNGIAPGAILPPPGENESYMDQITKKVPLGRPGTPEEITRAVLYLLQSDFVTGEIMHVAGGQNL